MRTFIILLMTAIPLLASAENESTSQDRVVFEHGRRVILRTSAWPDFDGGLIRVEQKLSINADGNPTYHYNAQDPETQRYHRLYCDHAGQGFRPMSDGESIFYGGSTGWACSGDLNASPRDTPAQVNPLSAMFPAAADYVYATAPSGSASVGANFYSQGYARYESSLAGAINTVVHVDSGRCRHSASTYHSGPFSGNITLGVNCIVQQPRFVSTGLETCIPKLCGSASGTFSIFSVD